MSAIVGSENSATEREAELVTESWNSETMSENRGFRNGLLVESERKSFSLPEALDDDGTDVSLKHWQLGLRSYPMGRGSKAVSAFRPGFKGSVRTRFTPIEPRLDENMHSPRHSSPERFETEPTTPRTPRTSSSVARSSSASPPSLISSDHGDSSLEKLGFSNGYGHHMDNVDGVSGSASPERTPGITFGEIRLEDAKSDNFGTRSGRGSSLRVSFTDELEISNSPSPPEIHNRSPLRGRMTQDSKDSTGSAPMPTRRSKPTSHGVEPRTEITSAHKPRGSPLPLPEIESLHQSHGVSANGDRRSQLRHSSVQITRSLDSIGERSKYDSSSNFTSGPPASPHESGTEDTSISNPNSPSFLLRCNARRQHDDERDEDVKVGMLCGGGLSDTNISGDFVRLLSKLSRLSVPLPRSSQVPKPSQERGREVVRSNSIPPQVFSWETQNSSMPCQDNVIIGRHNTLKLLCERCSNESTPSYNVHKPRKIRDHEPHQHFYKTISKTLDQMLRS